jgi:hypothetical protein
LLNRLVANEEKLSKILQAQQQAQQPVMLHTSEPLVGEPIATVSGLSATQSAATSSSAAAASNSPAPVMSVKVGS